LGAIVPDTVTLVRAGLLRRVFAMLVDLMVVALPLGAVGAALFHPTDGAIRVRNSGITYSRCAPTFADTRALRLPANFRITNVATCTRSFFGAEHDRILVVSEVTRSGWTTYQRSLTFPVDGAGRVTNALYIDDLIILLLPLYLIMLEWRLGTTVGKLVFGLHVRSLRGGPIRLSQAAIRTIIRLVWLFPVGVWALCAIMLGPARMMELAAGYLVIFLMVVTGLFFVSMINFVYTVYRRTLPWHDDWANTEVVRRLPLPPPPVQLREPDPNASDRRWRPH
jgi:uncharacterized RDD family membrane protein YckC